MIGDVRMYCSVPELIENYPQAAIDPERTWHCHHRLETDKGYTRSELKAMGRYYGVPPEELVFLAPEQHRRLHRRYGRSLPAKERAANRLLNGGFSCMDTVRILDLLDDLLEDGAL